MRPDFNLAIRDRIRQGCSGFGNKEFDDAKSP